MKRSILHDLGQQLRTARVSRKLTQPALAARLGRDRARISELERDLLNERLGRDRLALFVEICDALDLSPLLIPQNRLKAARQFLDLGQAGSAPQASSTAFDDVFVDLSQDEGK